MTDSATPIVHPTFGRRVARVFAKSTMVPSIVLAAMMVLMGVSFFAVGPGPVKLGGLLALVAAGLFVRAGLARSKGEIAVFERGVHVDAGEAADVAFDDLVGFRWKVTAVYVNGGYNHTVGALEIMRASGSNLAWSRNLERDDTAFAGVRDFLARAVVRRLEKELAERGRVAWVPGVFLTKDAVEIENGFVGGRSATTSIALRDLDVATKNAQATLRDRTKPASATTVDSGDLNFYPGLFLADALRRTL